MRRCMHIAVAFLAVFLLVRPFDCFAGGKFDQKAADCCKKGKCSPSNSDDCCKATVQGGNHLVAPRVTDHSTHAVDLVMAKAPDTMAEPLVIELVVEVHPPPGS